MKLRHFQIIDDPAPSLSEGDTVEFLKRLGQPTLIRISGRDPNRTRILVTLLHGNEPSGTMAIHRWLQQRRQPPVNVCFFVCNVVTALTEPLFQFRQLVTERDLNRCFKPPFHDVPGQIAQELLYLIESEAAEAMIDIHNTSGIGPSFAVSVSGDPRHQALVSHFTDRMIITNLKLGALMEVSESLLPTVTIECGGAGEFRSHDMAFRGIERFLLAEDPLQLPDADWGVELLHNPVRVELHPEFSLAYGDTPSPHHKVTLVKDIEHYNFGVVQPNTLLGWVPKNNLAPFRVERPITNESVSDKVLRVEAGKLMPSQPLKLFMITSNPVIAKTDCLFYAVQDDGHEVC